MLTIAACSLWCTNGWVLGSISSKEAEVWKGGGTSLRFKDNKD